MPPTHHTEFLNTQDSKNYSALLSLTYLQSLDRSTYCTQTGPRAPPRPRTKISFPDQIPSRLNLVFTLSNENSRL